VQPPATIYKNLLPDGYMFGDRTNVQPEEVMRLRESVGWQTDLAKRWTSVLASNLAVISVRDSNDMLVGMACLAGNVRHAVVCDLVVSPDHQHKGIGEAIMAQLEEATSRLGVWYVYAELAPTNPFREKMIASGFKETGASLFRSQMN
jgi:GNAT superfamily N-acetyltransferase